MRYYKFHISDYYSHTAHLEPLEDIAYRRMLEFCYLHECNLPGDPEMIARKIRMRGNIPEIELVLEEFFDYDEESKSYTNKRVSKELGNISEKSEKAKASAKARWDAKRNANASETHTETDKTDAKEDANDMLPITHNPLPNTHNPNTLGASADLVLQVWEYWAGIHQSKAKLNATVRGKIKTRLKSFTVDQIKLAIDGNASSPFHQGENDRKQKYHSLELICRNDENTQRFIDMTNQKASNDSDLEAWINAG